MNDFVIADFIDFKFNINNIDLIIEELKNTGANAVLFKKKYIGENNITIEEIPDDIFHEIRNIVYAHNIQFGCIVSDLDTLNYLDKLDIDFYYIPEEDLDNIKIILSVIKRKKPLILEVCSDVDMKLLDKIINNIIKKIDRSKPFVLLQNAVITDTKSLEFIDFLKKKYDYLHLGYKSCNTITSILALNNGINVIIHDYKKIITFQILIQNIKLLKQSLEPIHNNLFVKRLKRYLCISRNLPIGTILYKEDIKLIYAYHGISVIYLSNIIGSILIKPMKQNQLLQWDDINLNI